MTIALQFYAIVCKQIDRNRKNERRMRQPPYPIAKSRFEKDHKRKQKKDSLQIPLTNYKTKKQTKYNLQNSSVRIQTVISMAGKITRKWMDENYCLFFTAFFR